MEQFFKIADKFLKPVLIGVGAVFGLILLILVGSLLKYMSAFAGGWSTFLNVLYWIALVVGIICLIYVIVRKVLEFSQKSGSTYNNNSANYYTSASAPAGNPQQPVQNVQTNGEKICPVCGNKVPAGNTFYNNCGNKMN